MQAVKQEALDTIARLQKTPTWKRLCTGSMCWKISGADNETHAEERKRLSVKRCSEIFKHGEMDGSCLGAASPYSQLYRP